MALSEEKKPFKTKIPEKIMEEVSSFPSMPKAGIKLRALLAEKDVSVDDIEGILRNDPGLATNVLRLANSAFFGLRTKVSTLKHAVTLLGIKRFSQIAVSACMSKTMDNAVEGYCIFGPGILISKIKKDHFLSPFYCFNRNIRQIMTLSTSMSQSSFCYG